MNEGGDNVIPFPKPEKNEVDALTDILEKAIALFMQTGQKLREVNTSNDNVSSELSLVYRRMQRILRNIQEEVGKEGGASPFDRASAFKHELLDCMSDLERVLLNASNVVAFKKNEDEESPN